MNIASTTKASDSASWIWDFLSMLYPLALLLKQMLVEAKRRKLALLDELVGGERFENISCKKTN